MKIPLNEIKASPNPIRKTWDEEKMKELQWSLMEEGQVEPIGVRENGAGYIVVWGHRRVEAARRATWTEIDCVIVPADEVNNLIQAGIENLTGEDMTIDDKAEWAWGLTELGLSIREVGRRAGISQGMVINWITYKREKEFGVKVTPRSHTSQDEGFHKTIEIAYVLGKDLEAKKAIAEKTTEDELTVKQTRAVAEAYRDAPTPEIKAQILKTPVVSRDTAADILRRSTARVKLDGGLESLHEASEWDKDQEERSVYTKFDFAVKEFLDATKLYKQSADKVPYLVKYGKFSPEAAKFSTRKIEALIDVLKNAKEALEGVE